MLSLDLAGTGTYDVGDEVELSAQAFDSNGDPVEPDTAVVTVRDRDGVLSTPSVTKGTTSLATVTVNKSGWWSARWVTTGPVAAVEQHFYVRRSIVLEGP